jgi:hypothetical protein
LAGHRVHPDERGGVPAAAVDPVERGVGAVEADGVGRLEVLARDFERFGPGAGRCLAEDLGGARPGLLRGEARAKLVVDDPAAIARILLDERRSPVR